jgi:hypothetical protein
MTHFIATATPDQWAALAKLFVLFAGLPILLTVLVLLDARREA